MNKAHEPWYRRLAGYLKTSANWLIPGLGVKRWFFFIFLGNAFIGLGLAVILIDIYRTIPDTWWLPLISTISLRFFSRPLRAVIFGGVGLGLILLGNWGFNRSIISPFLKPGDKVVNALRQYRQKGKGPKIVVIGGGHGLATLLRGLKHMTRNLTAIVTMADDGGSSGILRKELGILPPGDVRSCLAALADDEALIGQLFQYRFPTNVSGLEGHSFGNLFISALSEITGNFEEAVAESGRVLAVHGQVLPSTIHNVRLVADMAFPDIVREVRVEGESQIPRSAGKIHRVWLEPNNPPAFPQVIQAVLSADIIIIGPGSLYTSILPNLLVPDLAEAIRASRAFKILICNIATQPGETDCYSCHDHIQAILDHTGGSLFDVVVANNRFEGELPDRVDWVKPAQDSDLSVQIQYVDLIDTLHPWRHDSRKIAQVVLDLFQERTGSLVE